MNEDRCPYPDRYADGPHEDPLNPVPALMFETADGWYVAPYCQPADHDLMHGPFARATIAECAAVEDGYDVVATIERGAYLVHELSDATEFPTASAANEWLASTTMNPGDGRVFRISIQKNGSAVVMVVGRRIGGFEPLAGFVGVVPDPVTLVSRDVLRRELRDRLDNYGKRIADDPEEFWSMSDADGGPVTLAHRVNVGHMSDAGEWCDWEWSIETSEEAHALVTIRCDTENGPREFVTYAVRAGSLAASAGFVVGFIRHAFQFGPRESAEILLPRLDAYGAWIVKVSA